ncbi:MAG: thermonuclease family protein [Rhodospirillales bacterium]|nr:MAG: thermonuclease family protein [Rhodospirillales bacterium]
MRTRGRIRQDRGRRDHRRRHDAGEDGQEWRLAGVVAPKRGDGARPPPRAEGTPPGPSADDDRGGRRATASPADAARAALDALVTGRRVWLRATGDSVDRHGRRFAIARTEDCAPLDEALLGAGHLRVYPVAAAAAEIPRLLRAEAAARADARGLWGDPRYALRRPGELARQLDSFVVVEGRVSGVDGGRGRARLAFGDDFNVTIEARVRRMLTARGIDPAALAGRAVRVRGWLRARDGVAAIDLTTADQLEIAER